MSPSMLALIDARGLRGCTPRKSLSSRLVQPRNINFLASSAAIPHLEFRRKRQCYEENSNQPEHDTRSFTRRHADD